MKGQSSSILLISGLLLLFLLLPHELWGHNCSSLRDCFGSARAVMAASAGLSVLLISLSIGLDFTPVIGDIKGVMESILGYDIITGEDLSAFERAMGIIPIIGPRVRGVGKMVDDVGDMGDHFSDLNKIQKELFENAKRTNLDELKSNKIEHIIEGSIGSNHRWTELFSEPKWENIKPIIKDTLDTAISNKTVIEYSKLPDLEKKIKGSLKNNSLIAVKYHDEFNAVVEVVFNVSPDGVIRISNAWVKNEWRK